MVMSPSRFRLLLVFALPVVAVVVGTWAMKAGFDQRRAASRAVLASTAIIGKVTLLLKLAVDAETGERGFVITESVEFLEPYDAALRRFDATAHELERQLADDPEQLVRAARAREVFTEWRGLVERQVVAPMRAGLSSQAAREFVRSREGKRLSDSLRALCDELVVEEERQLAERQRVSVRADRWARLGAYGAASGMLLALAIAILASLRFVRETGRLADAAHALAAGDLTTRVKVQGGDELGTLARTMNLLAERLEVSTREAVVLDQLRSALHACQDRDEARRILVRIAPHIFDTGSGAVYLINSSREQLLREVWWRGMPGERFGLEDCWALRRGQPYLYGGADAATLPCVHQNEESGTSLCLPLAAGSDTLGVLHLQMPRGTAMQDPLVRQALLVGETLALSLANLKLRDALRTQAIRDQLTGLHNRRYMEETLTRELARATRNRTPLGLIIFDVDHFKKYNDTHGHAGGDALLRALGTLAAVSFRSSDVVCRYGGEEFVAILPDSPLAGTLARAEVLRTAAKQLVVNLRGEPLGSVSISLGVAEFPRHARDGEALLSAADEALYRSKRDGRDRVTAAPDGA